MVAVAPPGGIVVPREVVQDVVDGALQRDGGHVGVLHLPGLEGALALFEGEHQLGEVGAQLGEQGIHRVGDGGGGVVASGQKFDLHLLFFPPLCSRSFVVWQGLVPLPWSGVKALGLHLVAVVEEDGVRPLPLFDGALARIPAEQVRGLADGGLGGLARVVVGAVDAVLVADVVGLRAPVLDFQRVAILRGLADGGLGGVDHLDVHCSLPPSVCRWVRHWLVPLPWSVVSVVAGVQDDVHLDAPESANPLAVQRRGDDLLPCARVRSVLASLVGADVLPLRQLGGVHEVGLSERLHQPACFRPHEFELVADDLQDTKGRRLCRFHAVDGAQDSRLAVQRNGQVSIPHVHSRIPSLDAGKSEVVGSAHDVDVPSRCLIGVHACRHFLPEWDESSAFSLDLNPDRHWASPPFMGRYDKSSKLASSPALIHHFA